MATKAMHLVMQPEHVDFLVEEVRKLQAASEKGDE